MEYPGIILLDVTAGKSPNLRIDDRDSVFPHVCGSYRNKKKSITQGYIEGQGEPQHKYNIEIYNEGSIRYPLFLPSPDEYLMCRYAPYSFLISFQGGGKRELPLPIAVHLEVLSRFKYPCDYQEFVR